MTIFPNTTNTDDVLDGDTAWLLTSSAMILFMTPGLAFFYGGLVRDKNIINTMMMCFVVVGLVTVHWVVCGYSFAFGGGNPFYGNVEWVGLRNVGVTPNPVYAKTIPHVLYMINQLMFAIITPAIISGSVVERMSFRAYILFVVFWSTLVYDTCAHWQWSSWHELKNGTTLERYGWLRELGAIDYAGGFCVHITSGFSALVAALVVGRRNDVIPEVGLRPSNAAYVLLGASILWFGWFGFNGGSALSANGIAALAFANTQISTGTAFLVWIILDLIFRKQASAVGAACGAVVGLVAITPSAGYVPLASSVCIGGVTCSFCYGSVMWKSKYLPRFFPQFDDSLDVFTCHGIGGLLGCIFTGLFSSSAVNPEAPDGLFYGNPLLLAYQLAAAGSTIVLSCVVTAGILLALKATIGVHAPQQDVLTGLDVTLHGVDEMFSDYAAELRTEESWT